MLMSSVQQLGQKAHYPERNVGLERQERSLKVGSGRASRNSGRSCAAGMDSRCCSARSSDIGRTSAKQSRLGNSAVMDHRICAHRALSYGTLNPVRWLVTCRG